MKSERFFQSARKRILRAQLQNCDHFFHNDILNFHDPSSQVDEFSEPVSSLKSTVVRYCTLLYSLHSTIKPATNKHLSTLARALSNEQFQITLAIGNLPNSY